MQPQQSPARGDRDARRSLLLWRYIEGIKANSGDWRPKVVRPSSFADRDLSELLPMADALNGLGKQDVPLGTLAARARLVAAVRQGSVRRRHRWARPTVLVGTAGAVPACGELPERRQRGSWLRAVGPAAAAAVLCAIAISMWLHVIAASPGDPGGAVVVPAQLSRPLPTPSAQPGVHHCS